MASSEEYGKQAFELARGVFCGPGRAERGGALREPGAVLLQACRRKVADPETDISAEAEALQSIGRGIGGVLAGGSGEEAGPVPPELETDMVNALQQLEADIIAERARDPLKGLDHTSVFSLAFTSVRIGAYLALAARNKTAECPQNAF